MRQKKTNLGSSVVPPLPAMGPPAGAALPCRRRASHNIAASSTQGIYGSRARLCPLGSGAPTRCHTDPPLQDVLMTPHFLSPHSSRGSPEVGLSLLPPLQAARWPADEEELELSGDRERRGEKWGERKLEIRKR